MSKQLLLSQNHPYRESNPEYTGEELHPQLHYGPIKERQCRDCFCCGIYTLFWGGMILIAIIAFHKGDPSRLASPFDPNGRQCGYGAAADYPYLYFTTPTIDTKKYCCIRECPTQDNLQIDCLVNDVVSPCPIPSEVYATQRYKQSSIESLLQIDQQQKWMSDIKATWPIALAVAFIALFVSMIALYLIRCCAGILIWTMILLYFVFITLLGLFCLQQANSENVNGNIPESLRNKDTLKGIGIALCCLSGLSFLIFVCIFRNIARSIRIMKCAAQFTASVKRVIIAPIIMFLQIVGFFAFWIVFSLYIFSCGEVKPASSNQTPYGQIEWDVGVKRSLVFYLFGLFWNIGLAIAIQEFIVASACSIWYFGQRQNNVHNPVSTGFKRAYIQSFGSLCLGSGILALVQIIKFLLKVIYSQAKSSKGVDPSGLNAVAVCCLKCSLCCVSCFERFFRFLSSNAYILMALQGKSFCSSAHDAFYLVIRNPIMFSLVNGIGKLFIILSTLFIVAGSSICGYFMITQIEHFYVQIYEPAVPTIMFAIISFTVAWVFMSIYGIAADTLLICLVCDKELGKGQPKHCPKNLSEFSYQHQSK